MAETITIHTAALRGIEALPVDVEVTVSDGLPRLDIIGLQGSYSWAAAPRIRSAIRVSGFSIAVSWVFGVRSVGKTADALK